MKLGDKIRTIRKMKGLTQENLADMLGISHTAVAKIERNETNPSNKRVEQIASALEVTMSQLESFGENGIFYISENDNNNVHHIFIGSSQDNTALALENARLSTEVEGLKNEIVHLKKIIQLLEDKV